MSERRERNNVQGEMHTSVRSAVMFSSSSLTCLTSSSIVVIAKLVIRVEYDVRRLAEVEAVGLVIFWVGAGVKLKLVIAAVDVETGVAMAVGEDEQPSFIPSRLAIS